MAQMVSNRYPSRMAECLPGAIIPPSAMLGSPGGDLTFQAPTALFCSEILIAKLHIFSAGHATLPQRFRHSLTQQRCHYTLSTVQVTPNSNPFLGSLLLSACLFPSGWRPVTLPMDGRHPLFLFGCWRASHSRSLTFSVPVWALTAWTCSWRLRFISWNPGVVTSSAPEPHHLDCFQFRHAPLPPFLGYVYDTTPSLRLTTLSLYDIMWVIKDMSVRDIMLTEIITALETRTETPILPKPSFS